MVSEPTPELEVAAPSSPEATASGVVGAAGILALGNVTSRVLGLGRELVIADLFGATGLVSVFRVAATLVLTLYDFLVGGLVTAALVPVFSDHAARRAEFWHLVSIVLSVIAVLLGVVVVLLEILAEPIFLLLGAGYSPELQAAGVQMIRLILPAVFLLGVAGVFSSILFALKRFNLPSFTAAAFNIGIIITSLALSPRFGITSAVLGVVIGSAGQVLLQWFGVRKAPIRFTFDLRHPVLRQIARLYIPVLGGLTVMLVGVVIDRNLASRTGAQSLAWMQAATYLVQLPLGLIAAAVSFAILPNLSRSPSPTEFRSTLLFGLRLVVLFILPAAVGIGLLAAPIVALLYEHGAFTGADTAETARALQLYVLGMPFAAVDQPLVFAFYARRNTLLPNLVAVFGLGVYLVVALALVQTFGFLALVLANSAQLAGHALLMLYLAEKHFGGLARGLVRWQVIAATLSLGIALVLLPATGTLGGWIGEALAVIVPAGIGLLVYFAALKLLRVPELALIEGLVRARLGTNATT